MDDQTRIGVGATAAFTIVGILAPMITWWVAGPLMGICGAIVLWGFWPAVRLIPSVGIPLGYVPLPKAAARLYGSMRGTEAAEFAERSGKSPDEVLDWYAYWMMLHGIRMFGKKPPSPVLEEIPNIEIASGHLHFADGATRLIELYDSRTQFTDLKVSRADIFARRKELGNRLNHP
jgi:hypothetical protein